MPTYELGIEIAAGAAAGAPLLAIRATSRRLRLKEIRLLSADGTQTTVGLGVPPGTQSPVPAATTSLTPLPVDPGDVASTAKIDTAWSTAPAVPAGSPIPWNRVEILAGVVGQGVAWHMPEPNIIPVPVATTVAGMIVLYNAGGGSSGALKAYVRLED